MRPAAASTFTLHEAATLRGPLVSSRPVLHTHTLCPYAQRVFLTLLLKAPFEFEAVHVDLSSKPSWYSRVNPRGLLPAVTIGSRTLVESMDICRVLDQLVPQPPLTPSAPAARQQMHSLLQQTSGIVSAGLDLVPGSTASHWGVGARPSRAQHKRFETACLALTQALQQHGGPYLLGDAPCLADMERFRLCLQLTQDYDLAGVQGGGITAWLDAMAELPACQLLSPDPSLFVAALRQHQSLNFFDYTTYTAAQLHPQLKLHC